MLKKIPPTAVGSSNESNFSDPVQAAVLANRLEAIIREMTNTVLKTARSAVISSGRDFSCSLVTADNQLLAVADGLPVHTFSSHLQTASIKELHPDVEEGDAYLHNDPYRGNTHAADQSVLVPIFIDGEHLFTAVAKAHQADIGNSRPTTYHAFARDVYEEGALIFPCMRVQRHYAMNEDIVRMCMSRIRVPEQWRGDFLATLGAARIAERRLKELCAKYGKETIKKFVIEWFDYSEAIIRSRIAKLPAAQLTGTGRHDPLAEVLPNGIPLKVLITVDPANEEITLDLRENIDCVPAGLNQSQATAINNVTTGVFNVLGPGVPRNSGAFRRIKVLLRENSVAGIPRYPASCSIATTNVGDRLVNLVQSAFSQLGEGYGLAEAGLSMGVSSGVISGGDFRHGGRRYINQLTLGTNGGPGTPVCDGWVTHGLPVTAGLTHRDSVEICEMKFPILFDHMRILPGTGGAGRHRGAPALEHQFGVRSGEFTISLVADGQHFAPKGVRGGLDGGLSETWVVEEDGSKHKVANFVILTLNSKQMIRGLTNGGGGYGCPLERDPAAVLADVKSGFETVDRARQIYAVELSLDARGEPELNEAATRSMRTDRREAKQ